MCITNVVLSHLSAACRLPTMQRHGSKWLHHLCNLRVPMLGKRWPTGLGQGAPSSPRGPFRGGGGLVLRLAVLGSP